MAMSPTSTTGVVPNACETKPPRHNRSRSVAESRSLGQSLADELSSYLSSQTITPQSTSTTTTTTTTTAAQCGKTTAIQERALAANDLVVHYRRRDGKVRIGVILSDTTETSIHPDNTNTNNNNNPPSGTTFHVLLASGAQAYATRHRLRRLFDTCIDCLVDGSTTHGDRHTSRPTSSPACPSSTTSTSSNSSVSTASSWTSRASLSLSEPRQCLPSDITVADQVNRLVSLALDARDENRFKRIYKATTYAIDCVRAATLAAALHPTSSNDPNDDVDQSEAQLVALHVQSLLLRANALLRLNRPEAAMRDATTALGLDPACTDAKECHAAALTGLQQGQGQGASSLSAASVVCGPIALHPPAPAPPPLSIDLADRHRARSHEIVLSTSTGVSPLNGELATTNPKLIQCDHPNDTPATLSSTNSFFGAKRFSFKVRPPMLGHGMKSKSLGERVKSINTIHTLNTSSDTNPTRPHSTRSHSAKEVANDAKRFISGLSRSFKDRRSSTQRIDRRTALGVCELSSDPPRVLRSPSSCSAASWPGVPAFASDDASESVVDENSCGIVGNRVAGNRGGSPGLKNRMQPHMPRSLSIKRAVRRISFTRSRSYNSSLSTTPATAKPSPGGKKQARGGMLVRSMWGSASSITSSNSSTSPQVDED
jgi:hypothetical protein